MSFLNNKSPITFLFELCLKRGLTPLFELENDSGPVHQRVFNIKVTAGEFIGRGSGSSKKKAKHIAALEAVSQMVETSNEDDSVSFPNISGEQSLNFKLQNNAVGELQELTQKKLLPLPTYEFEMTPGPPDVREFTCTVCLLKLKETGVGKSKKAAKRAAATALLDQIKVNDLASQLDEALKCFVNEFSILQSDIKLTYEALKEGRKPSCRSISSGIFSPKCSKQSPTYCDLLQEVAVEQHFEVTYVDLPEPTCTGLNQCIVQVSTMPVAVCHGIGQSIDEAHVSAALNTLLYLHSVSNIST